MEQGCFQEGAMNQTRLGSLIETSINILIGFVINYAMNLVILNGVMGMRIDLMQNLYIGLMFTVVSVARSYIIRRWFNAMLHRAAQRMAGAAQ
jgi:hypothetical protein